jgi:hypothetical protein
MINFSLAARRKPEDSQEKYFYEWGIIHVALMLTTPAVMEVFRRYVQHYSVTGITNEMLIHPLSEMGWDNYAEHWIESEADFDILLYHPDYVARMQPHRFGDHNFVVMVSDMDVIHQAPDFTSGGIKLINYLKKQPHLSHEEFADVWRTQHAPVVTEATSGLIRKYVQNRHRPLDAARLTGTLFEMGGVGQFSGIEEYWFDSLDDLRALRENPSIFEAITSSEAPFVDTAGSFSMVTAERVIYDFTLPESERSQRPAVLDPTSLEAAVYRQGLSGWNQLS